MNLRVRHFAADRRVESKQKGLLRGAIPELGTRHHTAFSLRHTLFYGGLRLELDDPRGKCLRMRIRLVLFERFSAIDICYPYKFPQYP